jgi:DNA-binding NarL/FixJ family response regulator
LKTKTGRRYQLESAGGRWSGDPRNSRAQTPALRAATAPQLFTDRQREIILLAAQGLSNKEIADRLTMSVRSVEGYLFRTSQRVGANRDS